MEITPGIKNDKFELLFEENYFKKNDWLIGLTTYLYAPWYIKIFGFKYTFQAIVLGEPIPEGDYFKYPVKLNKKSLYWFNFKVWDYGKVG